MAENDLTIGKIFLVLERYLFNAIRQRKSHGIHRL